MYDMKDIIEKEVRDAIEQCIVEEFPVPFASAVAICKATAQTYCVAAVKAAVADFLVGMVKCIPDELVRQLKGGVKEFAEELAARFKDSVEVEFFDEYKSEYCWAPWC